MGKLQQKLQKAADTLNPMLIKELEELATSLYKEQLQAEELQVLESTLAEIKEKGISPKRIKVMLKALKSLEKKAGKDTVTKKAIAAIRKASLLMQQIEESAEKYAKQLADVSLKVKDAISVVKKLMKGKASVNAAVSQVKQFASLLTKLQKALDGGKYVTAVDLYDELTKVKFTKVDKAYRPKLEKFQQKLLKVIGNKIIAPLGQVIDLLELAEKEVS